MRTTKKTVETLQNKIKRLEDHVASLKQISSLKDIVIDSLKSLNNVLLNRDPKPDPDLDEVFEYVKSTSDTELSEWDKHNIGMAWAYITGEERRPAVKIHKPQPSDEEYRVTE